LSDSQAVRQSDIKQKEHGKGIHCYAQPELSSELAENAEVAELRKDDRGPVPEWFVATWVDMRVVTMVS
jgi:hypothetical protein